MNTEIKSIYDIYYGTSKDVRQEQYQNGYVSQEQSQDEYTLQEQSQDEYTLQEQSQDEYISQNTYDISQHTSQNIYDATKLKSRMRKLWTDNAIFMRQFIVDLLCNSSGISYTTERLLKSQEQTGNFFKTFFGEELSKDIISLLKEHITITMDLLKAIKTGNITDISIIESRQIENIENLSAFLCKINSCYSNEELSDILKTYLILTKYQFIARMNEDYNGDIIYLDMGINHTLRISDYLSDGITEAFLEN